MRKVEVNWFDDQEAIEKKLPCVVEVPTNISIENISKWIGDAYGHSVESWYER